MRVSTFMGLADVHVNRAPCDGVVSRISHKPGRYGLAFKKDVDKENERNYILLEKGNEKLLVVQIAGFLARRIHCWVRERDAVKKGDPLGIIAFGSRVDIYIPPGYEIMVQLEPESEEWLDAAGKEKGGDMKSMKRRRRRGVIPPTQSSHDGKPFLRLLFYGRHNRQEIHLRMRRHIFVLPV